jgi:hypothetical protein
MVTDPLFTRADEAMDRAHALRKERQRLRDAAERLLDQKREVTQHLIIPNQIAVADQRGPK